MGRENNMEMIDLHLLWSVLARNDIIGVDNGGRLTRVYFFLPTKLTFVRGRTERRAVILTFKGFTDKIINILCRVRKTRNCQSK